MRIGGIASGIDTETIIRDLMRVERLPLDRFFQRKQTLEWQRDAQREMNLLLKNLDDSATGIRLRSSLNTRQTSVSDSSILTATANASVRNGTYDFNVTSIAKTEKHMSQNNIVTDTAEKLNLTTSFKSQIAVSDNAFEINGESFTVDDKSLNDILKEINTREGLEVRAHYDSVFDRVVIETTKTGIHKTDGTLEIELSGEFFSKININDVNNPFQNAANAEFTYKDNATALTTDPIISKGNRNTVGGITVNLQNTGTTTVTVTSNTDDAFDKIKSFVDKYNESIDIIQGKLNEPTHRGFPPLTDEQRNELSEREAELWDEKAKSGLLRRDQNLASTLNRMRSDLYTPVSTSGQFNQLAQIGITTTSNFRDGGKLEIDETKLRAALADDPDSVHQLLNNVAESGATSQEKYEQTGLVGRLRSSISNSIRNIVSRAGNENRTEQQFTIGREMVNVDQQIDRYQRRLADIENRYWAQFTAMEKAMNQANAQGMAFLQQLGGF
ncbi:hypothetical protein BKP45_07020 [Anaerobacillus alkalidiazotrophicus]|uniref:Flagellar hook-associated protein 2 n=1 Tax=Anaerobacillus alkalidiazotrophicus TaxID=472963 RepID=A0A1S2MCP4_9BACI|nr:flagellar filament capping protein FliD [Anaerobacillus alkalidiazotrophicus]OIJ22380.1 hypothetical protein BKP45_07020 [Anaerobacillus alkalidiazotrophicus]